MGFSVEIENVSVEINKFKALQNINAKLPAGETIAIIGPSGAGKTTLVKGIVGRTRLTSGEIKVFDHLAGSSSLRSQLTYMTQELSVYPDLTVNENLKYFAYISGIKRRSIKKEINRVLDLVDLSSKTSQLTGSLSGGEKQRISLSIALLGAPKLLVLDEPTVGLDPVLRNKLWQLFADLAKNGTTLIITSHAMDEAERCDDLVLLRDGQIVAHSSPAELLKNTKSKSVEESFLKLVGGKV